MLGKLIKYEYKATARTFFPIYIALLVVAITGRVLRIGNIDAVWAISNMVLIGLFIGLGVLTLLMVIERFNKNLLGDEGYLMFTLPVKSEQLILSKLIMSVLWVIISGIIAFITFLILIGDISIWSEIFTNWNRIWIEFRNMIQDQMYIKYPIVYLVIIGITGLVSYMSFILKIYVALAVAQLPIFHKNRGIMGLIAFLAINIILSICLGIKNLILPSHLFNTFSSMLINTMITGSIISIILFLITKWILDKHLNLE